MCKVNAASASPVAVFRDQKIKSPATKAATPTKPVDDAADPATAITPTLGTLAQTIIRPKFTGASLGTQFIPQPSAPPKVAGVPNSWAKLR